jgi:hypothetical protein
MLENSKPFESGLYSMKSNFPEKPITSVYNKMSQLKFPLSTESSNLCMKKDMQGTSRNSQDIAEINYSQFKNKLIDRKDHNSTFQKTNNIILQLNSDKANLFLLYDFLLATIYCA